MKRNFLVAVLSLILLTAFSRAQVPGVARISLIQGDVSTQRGDTGDWAEAALNQPLVPGDRISTGDNSRAELQLEGKKIELPEKEFLEDSVMEQLSGAIGRNLADAVPR